MSFVSSNGNILCRLINIEPYKIFAIINRALKGLHCNYIHCKYGARILINSQTSMFAALKFGNGFTSYFIPHFTGQVMNYPCLNQN